MATIVKTNELPVITDLTNAFVVGLDKDGNDARFPLLQLTRNDLGQFKTTDAAPATPLLNQSYELIGSAVGETPSGTYTNLLGVGGVPIVVPTLPPGYAILSAKAKWNGSYWVPVWQTVPMPIPDAQNFVNQLVVSTIPSYDKSKYLTSAQETSSTFSGWGAAAGLANNFTGINLFFATRTTAPTSIRVQIRENTKVGNILYDHTFTGLSLAASSNIIYPVDLGGAIANAANANLYVMYACNQTVNRWGTAMASDTPFPYNTYALTSYAVSGSQTMVFTDVAISGSTNRTNYVEFTYNNYYFNPTTKLLNDVTNGVTGLSTLPSTQTQLSKTSFNKNTIINALESFPFGSAGIQDTGSTFSGWGSGFGNPQGFNCISVFVQARSTPVSNFYFELRDTDRNGSVLASGTYAFSVAANTLSEVVFNLGILVANASANQLWFGYKADQPINAFGLTSNMPYSTQAYFTAGGNLTPGTWSIVTGGSPGRNIYIKTGTLKVIASPSADFMGEINKQAAPVSVFSVTADILLESNIICCEGIERNIYFANIINTNFPLNGLSVDITCTKGKQFKDFWRYLPTVSDAGTTTIKIDVNYYDPQRNTVNMLATKTVTLTTLTAASSSGHSIQEIHIGDSTTAALSPTGVGGNYLISTLTNDYGALNRPTMTFLGTQGSGANKHEGKGGKKFIDLVQSGSTVYRTFVSGITIAPLVSDTYSNNGSTFTITETNISGSSGNIAWSLTSGTNTPLSSGSMTRVTGSGDSSIAYSSVVTEASNGFWNASTGQLDVGNYLSVNGYTMSANDVIIIDFGINDVFSIAPISLSGVLVSIKNSIDTFITKFRSAVPNINVLIALTIPPAINQDSFGFNYSCGQTMLGYFSNHKRLIKYLIDTYDTPTNISNKIYVIGYQSCIDRTNNMQAGTMAANSRNTGTLLPTQINGIHPAQSGYQQKADVEYCFIKFLTQ